MRPFVPLRPFIVTFLVGLVLLSGSRLALALWHADAVTAVDGWGPVLLQGLRVDLASLCALLGLPAVIALLLPAAAWRRSWARNAVAAWLAGSLVLLVALEAATPPFMAEYGLRPNHIVVDYVAYPAEVLPMLAKGHALEVGLIVVLVLGVAVQAFAWTRRTVARLQAVEGPWRARAGVALLVVFASALGVRSTLGHRPMNPAMVAFSSDATVNALVLNSFYSLAHATRERLRDDPGARVYAPTWTPEKVVGVVRRELDASAAHRVDGALPVLVRREPVHRGPRRNIVIVLEESLGAQFVGSLGGRPLSPRIDQLAAMGWRLDRLYATGTRSIRGIEAVISGFPPTPSPAVVKRPLAQGGFFTLAGLLREHGYDTTFHYGGESHFDNMRGFFLANGFDRVIEGKDHEAPLFRGSWGVSDEDVFAKAHEDFLRLHGEGTPFFGFIFTSSNHDPFEFPDGRIRITGGDKATRDNGARYADHAVGGFFDRAMAAPYWRDTVFLVVADHDSRVFGQSLVPVDHFHIPGLFLGAGVTPRRDGRVASQIDLAPTLLSLAGIDAPTPLLGRDLNRPMPDDGRAMMQYDGNFAWMTGDEVLVLQAGKPPTAFRHVPGRPLVPAPPPSPGRIEVATAHALWGTFAYEQGWHRLPPSPEAVARHAGSGHGTTARALP